MKIVYAAVFYAVAFLASATEHDPLISFIKDDNALKTLNTTVEQIEIIRDDVAHPYIYHYDFSYLNSLNIKTPVSNMTDTGVYIGTEKSNFGEQRYIQGSYSLLSGQTINIALTAKISTLEPVMLISPDPLILNNDKEYSMPYEDAMNTTLGIIGKYQLTNNWAIIGSFSTTSLSNEVIEKASLHEELAHSALIGATYSF